MNLAGPHQEDPITVIHNLRNLVRDKQYTDALVGELPDKVMDVALSHHIDPHSGTVKD